MRSTLILFLLLAACAKPPADNAASSPDGAAVETVAEKTVPESPASLAGSQWQLVAFESMDDATGTQTPDNPGQYTMQLNADGSVNMQLNCNRANGTWTSTPSADGQTGQFSFGPLASTKALCPPPSMDEQITAQSQYITGYSLKNGHLYLSLMADGGIYEWQPKSSPNMPKDPELESAILKAAPDYTKAMLQDMGETGMARYATGKVDLNNDGQPEIFVYLMGSIFCGTGGCTLQLYQSDNGNYTLLGEFGLSRTPVIVSAASNKGWRDFWRLQSGGGRPSEYVRYRYNGNQYVEAERIAGTQAPDGELALPESTDFNGGIELLPQ